MLINANSSEITLFYWDNYFCTYNAVYAKPEKRACEPSENGPDKVELLVHWLDRV